MSANTWTPSALASNARAWSGSGWRAVEAQHKVATMGLAGDNLAHQKLLEDILEAAKPALPPSSEGLHWLLSTPFRYRPPAGGSRFRGPHDPGVFYGAEDRRTACAESGYWRLRFWTDSARPKAVRLTLFEFFAASPKLLDLSRPPLVAERARWTYPSDYSATQALANAARQAGLEAIRYESARYAGSIWLALLSPAPFRKVARPYRNRPQSWMVQLIPPNRVVWQRELSPETWSFEFPVPAA